MKGTFYDPLRGAGELNDYGRPVVSNVAIRAERINSKKKEE